MSKIIFTKPDDWFEDYAFVKRVCYDGLTRWPSNWIKARGQHHGGIKFVEQSEGAETFYTITYARTWYGKKYVKTWDRVSQEIVNKQPHHALAVYYKDNSFRYVYGTFEEINDRAVRIRNAVFPEYQYISPQEENVDNPEGTNYTGITG